MASVDHLSGDYKVSNRVRDGTNDDYDSNESDGDIIHEILRANFEIENERNIFYKAVVTIQRSWRHYVSRKELKCFHAAAIAIQKHVRGFLTRINISKYILQRIDETNLHFYNKMATRIQALFRGYQLRKVMNFHEVHEMRKRVMQKNEELRLAILEEQTKFEEIQKLKIEEEATNMVLYIIFKLHHYLRTHQIEGVYSLHGKSELSRIEELLCSAKFQSYMKYLRTKYNDTYYNVSPKIKIEKKKITIPTLHHQQTFCLYTQPPRQKYIREIFGSGSYKTQINNIMRTTDWNKHVCSQDFDLTMKKIPLKQNVPPYYLDFWARGCSIHDLDMKE